MIQKLLLNIVTVLVIAIVLTACGGKGIDRKLNYSGTAKELGESYGKAMVDATPEQQNILRERMGQILDSALSLAKNSNPANVEAVLAKKNADEFNSVEKMSVRELFVWFLKAKQDFLNSAISTANKYQQEKPIQVEKLNIDKMECIDRDGRPNSPCTRLSFDLSVFLRNAGDASVILRKCHVALVLDGKPIPFNASTQNHCFGVFEKAATEVVKFSFSMDDGDLPIKANIIDQLDKLYKTGNAASIAWAFTPSFALQSTNGDRMELDDESIEKYKAELAKITADLAVMKK